MLHGIERLEPELAADIAIIGAGPIGIQLLQVLKVKGAARITVVDRNANRAKFAGVMGADSVLTSLDDLPRDTFDVVVDATGAIPVMSRCIDFARHGGKVLLFGVPPANEQMNLEAFPIFRKGLTILSSFTSLRNSYQALDLLKHGKLRLDGLVSHKLQLEQFQDGIELLEGGFEDVRKVIIMPHG